MIYFICLFLSSFTLCLEIYQTVTFEALFYLATLLVLFANVVTRGLLFDILVASRLSSILTETERDGVIPRRA